MTANEPSTSQFQQALAALARTCPWEPQVSEELDRALVVVGLDVDAQTLVRAGDAFAAALCALAVLTGGLAPPLSGPFVLLGGGSGLAVAWGVRRLPVLAATARRTRALGAAPALVSRAVLRLRLSPSPERAAAFAATTGDGLLAESLRSHVERDVGAGASALSSFGDEWASWLPALRRSCLLVESAASAPPDERERTLDRALSVTLDGTRAAMAAFVGDVRGPTTAVYAFGVLVPLATVALLPAAGVAGLSVSLPVVVALYDVLLPAGLLAASGWILAHRPVAFPPPTVTSDHPAIPNRRWPRFLAAGVAGVSSWLVAHLLLYDWTAPIAGVGVAVGTALIARHRPAVAVHERVEAVESGLPDALAVVGREVERGRSVEAALADAAADVGGATGEVLDAAVRRQRQLGVDTREAFLGDHGALESVPSDRLHSAAAFLAIATREGEPAGRAVVALAGHLDDLRTVEAESRREIQRVTATLGNTAAMFGPLVGGATVTLARRLPEGGSLTTTALSPDGLGLAVGAYVLVLAAVLSALVAGLDRGFDRSAVGYRVGLTVVSATVTFLASMAATDIVL